jgi:cellulose synthase/poly-beta-1,6-N-acetylglucosamine synthase-like glycosyltransferase
MSLAEILNTILALAIIIACLPAYYLGLATWRALAFRFFRQRGISAGANDFPGLSGTIAFVIPAHNESDVIVRTILSLKALSDNDFTINIVADNCTDNTAALSRENGAIVYERRDATNKSKGHALAWLIPQVLADHAKQSGRDPLAVVVVDADATMSPSSATFARRRFSKGQKILQSAYVLEAGSSGRSKVMSIAFSAINVVRGYARAALDVSDTFKGNGMWFRADVIKNHPWQAFSLAEDLEFGLMLRRAGYKIEFFGESVVTGLPGEGDAASSNQRARWESGRLALVIAELPKTFKAWLKRPTWSEFDLMMELATPPLTFYVMTIAISALTSLVIGLPVWITVTALICLSLHLLAAIPLGGHPWSAVWDLAGIPLFFAWKILLLPRIWRDRASKVWIRTDRDSK